MYQNLLALFAHAKGVFFAEEINNILNGTSERNLCGRLAMYIDRLLDAYGLTGYYADIEYNRKQDGRVKTILNDNYVEINICCDLILHKRGEVIIDDNLIAIEMKKSNRPEAEKIDDKNRLRALTKNSYDNIWTADGIAHPEHVCGYRLGVYLELNITQRICRVELYKAGNIQNFWEEPF